MSPAAQLLDHYRQGIRLPDVSGFEILELLDIRSRLAEIEKSFSEIERKQLEDADRSFFRNANLFYKSVSTIASLAEMRERARVTPSHWWWYLDEFVQVAVAA